MCDCWYYGNENREKIQSKKDEQKSNAGVLKFGAHNTIFQDLLDPE